jgi:hypothetical protein
VRERHFHARAHASKRATAHEMSKTVHIERLAREYAERGYVVVEDYLARDVVDACRTECEDVMRCVSSAIAKAGGESDRAKAWTDVCSVRA